ncbi:MAG: hypothetical protein H6907_21505 [Hyphomicrobiales bacterium]|nr:hypothetical protein [Hyphomicrobiales bacterium]MCP5374321.1 hypothetical protein [Hyphomicrobiales bacterium]
MGLRAGLSISAAVTLGIVFAAGWGDPPAGGPLAVGAAEPWYGAVLHPERHLELAAGGLGLAPAPKAAAAGLDRAPADGTASGLSLLAHGEQWSLRSDPGSCDSDRYLLRPGCVGLPWTADGAARGQPTDDQFRFETAAGPAAAGE